MMNRKIDENCNSSSLNISKLKVGIIGNGVMGKQIVRLHTEKEIDTTIFVKKDRIGNINTEDRLLKFTSEVSDLMNCDIVIESLPELIDVKVKYFCRLLELGYSGLLCTNTSTITLKEFYAKGISKNSPGGTEKNFSCIQRSQ